MSRWTSSLLHANVMDVLWIDDSEEASGTRSPRKGRLISKTTPIIGRGLVDLTYEDENGACRDIQMSAETLGDELILLELSAQGSILGKALALRDRNAPGTILASWGRATVQPTGIVKYTIQDAFSATAYYASVMALMSGDPTSKGGRAVGRFDRGYAGRHAITYEGYENATWGPYEWMIESSGDVFDLTWKQNGELWMRGFGFTDPDDPTSIIVSYRGVQRP